MFGEHLTEAFASPELTPFEDTPAEIRLQGLDLAAARKMIPFLRDRIINTVPEKGTTSRRGIPFWKINLGEEGFNTLQQFRGVEARGEKILAILFPNIYSAETRGFPVQPNEWLSAKFTALAVEYNGDCAIMFFAQSPEDGSKELLEVVKQLLGHWKEIE